MSEETKELLRQAYIQGWKDGWDDRDDGLDRHMDIWNEGAHIYLRELDNASV